MRHRALLLVVLVLGAGCGRAPRTIRRAPTQEPPVSAQATDSLALTSTAFPAGGAIPSRHTCEGEDVSPPLAWVGAPDGTISFALIVDDPDAPDPKAPKTTWVHWVLYDLPGTATTLPEGVRPDSLPGGTRQGLNDWKQPGWRGPCPPVGRHRYFFKLYALDAKLGELPAPNKAAVEQAMQGHVLAHAEWMGTYEKGRR